MPVFLLYAVCLLPQCLSMHVCLFMRAGGQFVEGLIIEMVGGIEPAGPPLCLGVVSPSFVSRCWSVNARLLNELVLDVRNIITKKTRTHHLLLG